MALDILSAAPVIHAVGDIHGQLAALRAMLERLGWQRAGEGWRHPRGERLLFVGDLVDRGPDSRGVVETVRRLVADGEALCLMGNHEFNAVQFHTPDPDAPGEYLRPRKPANERQHQATLGSFQDDPAGLREALAWFRTLPVAVELPHLRAVHACFDPAALAALDTRRGDDGTLWTIPDEAWLPAARRGTPEFAATERVLKGPERDLPHGWRFHDKDGHERAQARLCWWHPAPANWAEATRIAGTPIGFDPEEHAFDDPAWQGYAADERPVLFGHYWNRGPVRFERPNAACLDYSAGKGDRLVAYPVRPDDTGPLQESRAAVLRVG